METNDTKSMRVEPSKSASAKCINCHEPFRKGELRMNVAKRGFFHLDCFRENVGFIGSLESVDGFADLSDEDKKEFTGILKGKNPENDFTEAQSDQQDSGSSEQNIERLVEDVVPPAAMKKIASDGSDDIRKQEEVLCEVRHLVRANMLESQLVTLLKANKCYDENATVKTAVDILVDGAVFGVPLPCPECGGVLAFKESMKSYSCLGCGKFKIKEPSRKKMVIPAGMRDNDFLSSYQIPKLPERIIY